MKDLFGTTQKPAETSDALSSLNPEQRKAVTLKTGPILIIAGAGTGKTRVITNRIAHLLNSDKSLPADSVLALTYTRKAAEEMSERVGELLKDRGGLPQVSTFHAFSSQILRDYGIHIGLSSQFKILASSIDRLPYLEGILWSPELKHYKNISNPVTNVPAFLRFIDRAKDELVAPDDYEAYIIKREKDFKKNGKSMDEEDRAVEASEIEREKEALLIYRYYEESIKKAGVLDYGDLIVKAVELLKTRPAALKDIKKRLRYILVDEFQDTNIAQIELLGLIAGDGSNVCVVGDDDQAIYRFRGASYASFQKFREIFPKTQIVKLTQNYRSTKNIIEASGKLIENNGKDRYGIEKTLWTENEKGERVEIRQFADYESEARWVAEEINNICGADGGARYGDIAILVRAHSHKDFARKALDEAGVPFNKNENTSLFDYDETKDMIAFLEVVENPSDSVAFARVLTSPYFSFSGVEMRELSGFAKKNRLSIFDAVPKIKKSGDLGAARITDLKKIRKIIESLHKMKFRRDAAAILRALLEKFQIIQWHIAEGERSDGIIANIGRFFQLVSNFASEAKEKNKTGDFLRFLALAGDLGFDPDNTEGAKDENCVSIITAHGAKGLEFPVVFMISLTEGRFPSRERADAVPFPEVLMKEALPEGDFRIEEERRLFYVGMTRAKKKLYLTTVKKPRVKPSTFIEELKVKEKEPVLLPEETDFRGEPFQEKTETRPAEEEDFSRELLCIMRVLRSETTEKSLVSDIEMLVSAFLRVKHRRDGLDIRRIKKDALKINGKNISEFFDASAEEKKPAEVKLDRNKLTLSHTQIETYDWCPLKYKFSYVWRIPSEENVALTFGTMIHEVFAAFCELVKGGEEASLEKLRQVFDEKWDSKSYSSEEQAEGYREKGLKIIESYWKNNEEEMKRKPLFVEQEFRIAVGDVKIKGKFDRVDEVRPGVVSVLDYKTGKAKKQSYAEKSLQLPIYAIALKEAFGLEPENLTFYYLEHGASISTTVNAERESETKAKILETAGKIAGGEYPPCDKSKRFMACRFCEYRKLCPFGGK